MKVRIIPPRERHIPQLLELSQAFAAEHDWAEQTALGGIKDLNDARAALFMDGAAVRVAEHPEGKLIGFAGVYPNPGGHEAQILVAAQYRRAGVGKQLADSVFSLLPGGVAVEARILQENTAALAAAPQLGFDIYDTYYEDKTGKLLRFSIFRRQTNGHRNDR